MSWTCEGCSMRVSYLPGFEVPDAPPRWAKAEDGWRCLACRRSAAVDLAAEAVERGETAGKAKVQALVSVELEVDPDRQTGEIARRLKLASPQVAAARKALSR